MYKEVDERIETEFEVTQYLKDLHYSINHGASINFQVNRIVDSKRAEKYTNEYTIHDLFPDEDPKDALKRELLTLNVDNYVKTVKDIKFPNRSEMRVFSKVYNLNDVYIKIRIEILGGSGCGVIFVMSFHYAEHPISEKDFTYRK